MRAFALVAAFCLALPGVAADAQEDQTLADIRQELSVLYVEMQRLRRNLSTTGGPSVAIGGDSVLDRVGAIEAEMQRLTSKTEELEFRISRIVEDATNRIGDLEFRLVELEGGDVSQLGETTTLGGAVSAPSETAPLPGSGQGAAEPAPGGAAGGAQLAVGEEADFRAAQTALSEGDYPLAADRFDAFLSSYPGSPLAAAAELGRGEALEVSGDTEAAARAYLSGFSIAPDGPLAPLTLFRLGRALGTLDQTGEACLTLGEVAVRFPSDPSVAEAEAERTRLGCT